jgi:hypothetical protein
MTANFCNVITGPNTGGYGARSGSGSNGGPGGGPSGGAAIQRIVQLIESGQAGLACRAWECGEPVMASQMASAIVSVFTIIQSGIRCGWLPRLTGVTAVMLLAITAGTVNVPAQQPRQQQQQPISDTSLAPSGSFLLTIFLKHDESKTLDQINAQLRAQGFYKAFPPDGTAGSQLVCDDGDRPQVVTLRVPAERLRRQSRDRADRVGRLSDRVLSHLRP